MKIYQAVRRLNDAGVTPESVPRAANRNAAALAAGPKPVPREHVARREHVAAARGLNSLALLRDRTVIYPSIGRVAYRPDQPGMEKMMYGYMISSSDSQKIAAQLKAAGCDKIHRDSRGSAKTERAQRRRAIEQLASGDVIVVARLNQIADSTLDLLGALTSIAEKKAVFRSLAEPWADSNQRSVKLLTMLEGIATFERDVRSARTEAGQARAVARGVKLGRKPKLTPKQEQDALRRRKKGETLATIAESYNVSHSTISRLVA
jgi:DNA invertase Pin-like site-specific DNA recombinase